MTELEQFCNDELSESRSVFVLFPNAREAVTFKRHMQWKYTPKFLNQLYTRSSLAKATLRALRTDTLIVIDFRRCDYDAVELCRETITRCSRNPKYTEFST